MPYKLVIDPDAEKALKKLDRPIRETAKKFFDRLEQVDNPRSLGHALSGVLAGLWTYPIRANWRSIARIEDKTVTIVVLDIGSRADIYR